MSWSQRLRCSGSRSYRQVSGRLSVKAHWAFAVVEALVLARQMIAASAVVVGEVDGLGHVKVAGFG